jgi:hypothetical protein
VPEMGVSNWEIVLISVHYQPDPLHLPSHPIDWCHWTVAILRGSADHSLDLIPFGILVRFNLCACELIRTHRCTQVDLTFTLARHH